MNPATGERTHQPRAPWSWSTEDAELAVALEQKLRQSGVKQELCTVSFCSTEEKTILAESWSGLVGQLQGIFGNDARSRQDRAAAARPGTGVAPEDSSKCHNCHTRSTDFPQPLMKCKGCGKAWYCSRDCQKKHWKRHRPTCHSHQAAPSGEASTTSGGIGTKSREQEDPAHWYYNHRAYTSDEAQALASSVNLTLPRGSSVEGTMKPVRRLVTTDKDTSENLTLLFGPAWKRNLKKIHREARMEVLLNPPRGSSAYASNARSGIDSGASSWSLRPASEVDLEQQKINEIRELQAKVRDKIGVGRSPQPQHVIEILQEYGEDWDQKLDDYTLAINTMDQSVRVP